jgi:hypothetical protein
MRQLLAPKPRGASTGSTPVLTFPSGERVRSSSEEPKLDLASRDESLAAAQEHLKEAIEAWVAEAYMTLRVRRPFQEDNPFDEVYISILRPDRIEGSDIDSIMQYFHIRDLSDQITFADGLDE